MKKITPFLYLTLTAFAAVTPLYVATPQAIAQQQKTLYQRLGGYDKGEARIRTPAQDSASRHPADLLRSPREVRGTARSVLPDQGNERPVFLYLNFREGPQPVQEPRHNRHR